jgi:hypothetical protein
MLPQRVYLEGTTQQLNLPLPVAATQEDQPPLGVRLQVQTPVPREGPTPRCGLDPNCRTLPMCRHIAGRLYLQPLQRRMVEPCPHFGLPQAVEALDGPLEAHLPGRNKHGHDSQAQADTRHTANGVGVNLRPLEERVVVELRVVRQADRPPVLHQGFHHESGRNCGRVRPGHHQAAVQGDAIENLDRSASTNDQPLDQVEAVQFGTPVRDPGQVPTRTGRGTTDSPTAVQGSASLQDQADRANGRRIGQATGEPRAVDGGCPELAEVTGLTQLLAEGQHQVLPLPLGAIDRRGQATRVVGPVHAIEALSLGAFDPALHRGQSHAELLGHLTHGGTASDGLDHGTSALFRRGFCSW